MVEISFDQIFAIVLATAGLFTLIGVGIGVGMTNNRTNKEH